MSLVQIKQIPDDYAESIGLAKYGRSRMPGCVDRFMAREGIDGRRITGIDEGQQGLTKDQAEKIKELRLDLEKKTNQQLDPFSPFWDEFLVSIYSDTPKTFDTNNPMDIIALRMLKANGFVVPNKEMVDDPRYIKAQYYAYTEESENAEEVRSYRKRDDAIVELSKIADNKEKLLLYGQYLEGIKYSPKFKIGTLYEMLRAYITDKDLKNATNFLSAVKLPVEELQQKIIVDKAIKQRLIQKSVVGKKQVYQFGQTTLGFTIEEVYRNLATPEYAPELMTLAKELNS